MSVPFSGRVGYRSAGVIGAINKEAKQLSLKPVKRIVFQFDPFLNESQQTRDFLYNIGRKSLIKTNPSCLLKTNIVCDRSDPSITFVLENGSSVLFKSKHLTSLEMFQLYNKHITSLLPKEEPVATIKTKAEKAAQKRR